MNQRQLTLFGDIRLQPADLANVNVNGRMTWLLLMHRDLKTREVRCELSRPVNMNEDGRVDGGSLRRRRVAALHGDRTLDQADARDADAGARGVRRTVRAGRDGRRSGEEYGCDRKQSDGRPGAG